MKVTQVSLGPTQASLSAERATLVPEMLAAVGARYSRSNLGLEAILDKVSTQDQEQSIDAIFRFVDFGHASVADMVPVAIFMDGISMWLAYHIWALCPTAGGQESSTRYIKLSADNLPDAAEIGIPEALRDEWHAAMKSALDAYEKALQFWENVALQNPSVTRIPRALLEDDSEKTQKTVARMRRNYAFDRARYFLPAALKTNVMMVQSARAWVSLCQNLLSHPLPEAQNLGNAIRGELALVAPRLLKHAAPQPSFCAGTKMVLDGWSRRARDYGTALNSAFGEQSDDAFLEVMAVEDEPSWTESFAQSLQFHDNRYGFTGPALQRTAVRFEWRAVALADIRDLNRHRTGTKWCPMVPQGFYGARDQHAQNPDLEDLSKLGAKLSRLSERELQSANWTFVYWILLGTQFPFEHTTTADKFIYEAELRTGVGAHYRYAKHLHDVLALWYEKFPETKGLILEGSAEPE